VTGDTGGLLFRPGYRRSFQVRRTVFIRQPALGRRLDFEGSTVDGRTRFARLSSTTLAPGDLAQHTLTRRQHLDKEGCERRDERENGTRKQQIIIKSLAEN
jgi:hypothetical protein